MVNNKKNKSSKKVAKEGAAAESAPVTNEFGSNDPLRKSFTSGQFICFIFLAVGLSYLVQFSSVIKDGVGSKACTSYVPKITDGCSETDITMLTAKFYSSIFTFFLVTVVTLACWTRESLLLRLLVFLMASPLFSSVLAIQVAKELDAHPTELFKLGLMITALLIAGASAVYSDEISPRLPFVLDLQNSTLFMVMLAESHEIWKLVTGGVSGYLTEEPTLAAQVILPFLCVDHSTIVALVFFSIFFLPNNLKRSFLFLLALSYFVTLHAGLPTIQPKLVEAEYYEQFLMGAAMFCLTAAFGPEISFFKEPKHD